MPNDIKQRGKIWYFNFSVNGRRHRDSTNSTDKKTAQRIAAKAKDAAWGNYTDGEAAHVTMAQAIDAYLNAEKSDRFLLPILDYWKDTPVRKITVGAIKQSAIDLLPNAKAATRNRNVVTPTLAVLNHASSFNWCLAPNGPKAKHKATDPKKKTPATLVWILAFADQARKDGLPHLAALAIFMFGTGARRGEACELIWSDIDLQNAEATINQTKTDAVRISNLPPDVVAAIANIPSNHKQDEPVFGYASGESVGQVWGNVCERARIEKLTPHCCRHGFATMLLRLGYDVATVAMLGGWKDAVTVLKHYAHPIDDPTLNNALFDTNLTQDTHVNELTNSNKKEISK